MFEVEAVVIGAGVVGLAVARELARAGREVVVLESAGGIGTGVSSRNSEVIHAGIYYPPGSLKAKLCVEGKHRLYEYCAAAGVAHQRCGKLLVAVTDEEVPKLAALAEQAARNGVHDLQPLDADAVAVLEPEVRCVAGLLSPSTGIIDSHGFMLALQGDVEAGGGSIAFETPVEAWAHDGSAIVLETGGAAPATLKAQLVVNAAGHGAVPLLGRLAAYPPDKLPVQSFCKGNYFGLRGPSPFQRLIYPIPEAAGLGVHATLDLGGRARFGPDTEWISDDRSHDVDPARAERFYPAIRRYWPGLPDDALYPDYAGIRPKLHREGEPMPDFRIEGPAAHGVPGLVNLLGVESPGLTASLAIAAHVSGLAAG